MRNIIVLAQSKHMFKINSLQFFLTGAKECFARSRRSSDKNLYWFQSSEGIIFLDYFCNILLDSILTMPHKLELWNLDFLNILFTFFLLYWLLLFLLSF